MSKRPTDRKADARHQPENPSPSQRLAWTESCHALAFNTLLSSQETDASPDQRPTTGHSIALTLSTLLSSQGADAHRSLMLSDRSGATLSNLPGPIRACQAPGSDLHVTGVLSRVLARLSRPLPDGVNGSFRRHFDDRQVDAST